jgi:hypothetical protein
VGLAKRLGYAIAREDLKGLIESLRDLPKDHRKKLIMMGYKRLGKWIDSMLRNKGFR